MKTNPNIKLIQDAAEEAKRFLSKCEDAEGRLIDNDNSTYGQYQFKEVASLKRSALDLKTILTSITQMKSL